MAVVKINLSCELTEAVKVQYIRGNLFSQDNQANVINVAVFEGGEPTELAGTVTANVIRPDGGTVAVTGGTFEGNVATITMPSAVYAIPGMISVAVKITLDSVVTTIAAFAATVYATSTDTAVDPGTIIPSIQTLIAEIEAAVDSIPADYSSLWATLAPNYSNLTFPVAVGQYCTFDGGFYRCNTAIATQEAWTAAHWTATNIGADLAETRLDVANLEDDVSELKSAIGTVPTGKTVQGQIDALENGLEKGTYEDLTAGNALYLLSDRGDTDVAPYVFRKTGGAKNGYGREFLRKIVGGTVVWNQLVPVPASSISTTSNGVTLTDNRDGSYTIQTGDSGATGNVSVTIGTVAIPQGHKILLLNAFDGSSASTHFYQLYSAGSNTNFNNGNGIYNVLGTTRFLVLVVKSGDTIATAKTSKPIIFDLTQMFGSTIADAIYAMEQATAGSGVAWFRSLFPNSYYAYDAGSLQSVQAKEHRLTGKNIFRLVESEMVASGWNRWFPNPCRIPGTYTFSCHKAFGGPGTKGARIDFSQNADNSSVVGSNIASSEFGKSENNVTANVTEEQAKAGYIRFGMNSDGSTFDSIVCGELQIEFGSTATAYEPYKSNTYPLDSTLTLRGIPKWDSTNGLYYDGDEYKPDGSVKRKYGIVDLGSLTWVYNSSDAMMYVPFAVCAVSTLGLICSKYYTAYRYYDGISGATSGIHMDSNMNLYIKDPAYTDAATFKTAMSGVYLVYELATPTTETADPYRELQISAHGGTEEFIDAGVTATTPTRDVSVPVGIETFYPVDIWHLIDELTALVLENISNT